MSAFNSLKQFILQLSPAEIEYCRNHVVAFDSRGDKSNSKSLQLFNILVKSDKVEFEENEIVFLLYSRKNADAFTKLLQRLRDKLLDALSSEINVVRERVYNKDKTRLRILMRRRLNHVDMLIARKQFNLAKDILDWIVDTSDKSEIFDELLTALRLYSQLYFKIGADETVNNIQRLVANCRRSISQAETANLLYMLSKNAEAKDIAERITEVRKYAQETPSLTDTYFQLGMKAQEMRVAKNYVVVQKLVRQQLNLALNNMALRDYNAIAQLHLELALNSMHMKKFTRAEKFVRDAERYFGKTNNKDNADLQLYQFHSLLYAKRFDDAAETVKKMNLRKLSPVRTYLKAVIAFLNGKYGTVIDLLAERKPTYFTTTNLGYWPFILAQMAIITKTVRGRGKLPMRVINGLSRLKQIDSLSPREKTADMLIRKLISHKLDFTRVRIEAETDYRRLQSKDGEYAWTIFSSELIPFDDWFFSMISNTDLTKEIKYNR